MGRPCFCLFLFISGKVRCACSEFQGPRPNCPYGAEFDDKIVKERCGMELAKIPSRIFATLRLFFWGCFALEWEDAHCPPKNRDKTVLSPPPVFIGEFLVFLKSGGVAQFCIWRLYQICTRARDFPFSSLSPTFEFSQHERKRKERDKKMGPVLFSSPESLHNLQMSWEHLGKGVGTQNLHFSRQKSTLPPLFFVA